MGSKRFLLLIATGLAVLALLGIGLARWPGAAPAAPAPSPASALGDPVSTVVEGFESPHPAVGVSTDNLDFRHGTPYVGLKKVSFVPGAVGNAMRVDFSIIGGYWQNVMVKLNQGVPWNLTGQTQLSLTMKGDWADTKDAQSVSLMMKMTNGSFWGVSFAVTKHWKTYTFPLDAAGTDWYSSGPDWGWKDKFTLDRIAYITFFVSPPKTGSYSLWFDDLSVQGGPLQSYDDPDKPTPEVFSSIPYAIGQAVDDMGWRDWDNRHKSVLDYQKLIHEHATLADYQTVVDIGKAAGTRLTTVWILQDLDKHNVCAKAKYNTPVAHYDMTIDGTKFRNHVTPDQVQAMDLVKRDAAFMEFGMHGVSHEHYRHGVEQRAEYAHIDESVPGKAQTWGWRDMNLKAQCYREILRQWFRPDQLTFPVAEVPPAHAYFYSTKTDRTTGALLHKYGVKYVNGGMNVSTRIYKGYLIDHGVIFVNRAYGTNWDWVGSTPWEGYWNDFDKPYYPSDDYAWQEAHFPNLWGAKAKWVKYLVGLNDSNNRFLARNSAEASWQFLYHKFGTITQTGADSYTIDVSKVDPAAYRWNLIGPLTLKVWVGDQNVSSVALTNGAKVLACRKDTFGYAYLVIGVPGNPMSRLDRTTYDMTVTFGATPMPAYVDLTGATYNVYDFTAGSDSAAVRLEMYGTQDVKVHLPFTPQSVMSSQPDLIVQRWSYADGVLTMRVRGVRLTGEKGTITISTTPPAPQPAYKDVDDFLYQLQYFDFAKAGATKFDLVITDYSENGHESTRFHPWQIAWLKQSPGGPKRVLAYMSIGEAETYRWYWKKSWDANLDGIPDAGAPSWLGTSNPDWLDNYKVRFWDPRWQRIIYGTPHSYLDKVLADGYDGVYLDIIDAYEYWGPGGEGRPVRTTAARDMVTFVKRLAHYARVTKHHPDFAIFPQNGSPLGRYPDYMAVVTGLGQEDTWYNGNLKSPWTAETVPWLKRFIGAGKLVLCTDYCRKRALVDDFYAKAQAIGAVPYATRRDLDKLVINPGHEPD